jgi:hypothetical protein
MKIRDIFVLAALIIPAINAQISKEEAFNAYSKLLGGSWETKGTWENGGEFHQEIIVETELTKTIFTVKTYDYIDSNEFDNSQRNYGIRAWDEKEKKIKTWDFDVFGGIITGEIIFEENNIYHVYEYPDKKGGTMTMTDAWTYIDDDTYEFKIAEFKDGKPGKIYMNTMLKRKNI